MVSLKSRDLIDLPWWGHLDDDQEGANTAIPILTELRRSLVSLEPTH